MRKEVIFLVVLVIVQGLNLETRELHDQLYQFTRHIGQGYNIFKGNPLGVDNGFTGPIFSVSYNMKMFTDNGGSLIPDNIFWVKQNQCDNSANVAEIRGTKSYQQQLENMVSIGEPYSGGIFSAAFSLSPDYKKVEQETLSNKKVDIQSTAKCTTYKLIASPAFLNRLHYNFVSMIQHSQWGSFIDIYGTHYIKQIQFGGRYTRRLTFSQESMAKMKASSTNTQLSAKGQYGESLACLAKEPTRSSQVSDYFRSSFESSSDLFVGGTQQFLPGTRIFDKKLWKTMLASNPMPVRIKMSPISDLFNKIPGIDATAATLFFKNAINKYRQQNKLSEPKDAPALYYQLEVAKTPEYGGMGGFFYSYRAKDQNWGNLKKIVMHCGQYVNKLEFGFFNGKDWDYSHSMGRSGGAVTTFTVDGNDRIASIYVWMGAYMNSIQFRTASGKISKTCGDRRYSTQHIFAIGSNERIIGIIGREADIVDRFGLILGKSKLSTLSVFVPQITKQSWAGGNGGSPFESIAADPATQEVRKVVISSGIYIDSIEFFYGTPSETNPSQSSSRIGSGTSGNIQIFVIPVGQYLSQIIVKSANFVDSIEFVTSGGIRREYLGFRKYQSLRKKFGGSGGKGPTTWTVSRNRFVGLYGTSGSLIDKIGFFTATRP